MNFAPFLLLLGGIAHAATGLITEDFSTYHGVSASTGIWNRVTQRLHVPYASDFNGDTAPDTEDAIFSIGTGEDGPFDSTTFTIFNPAATASLVTLDSTRIYNFTTFNLPSGATLRATGSSPLRIYVQGEFYSQGTIDVSGGAGGTTQATVGAVNGGTACCGGGAGGIGKTIVAVEASTNGASPTGGNGGLAGQSSAVGANAGAGGGGGSNQFLGFTGGAGGGTTGGSGAAPFGDVHLFTLLGGSGGGGGGNNTNTTSRGGGGGGGGGVVALYVGGDFNNHGNIFAKGGQGGVPTVAHNAGGGGGGGGGSILVYGAGAGNDYGNILANLGSGGNDGGAAPDGGDAGDGINWFSFDTFPIVGGTESPAPVGATPRTFFSTALSEIISAPYDTENTNPSYTTFTPTATLNPGDTITYEVAGSTDGFVADDSGYISPNSISSLSGRRYIRFRVRMQAHSRLASPRVTQIQIGYQAAFDFSLLSCGRVLPHSAGRSFFPLMLIGLLGVVWWVRRSWANRFPSV